MQSQIPALLGKSGMSVNALSKVTGLSRTTLTPLSKSTTIPSKTRIETLELIASALDVSVLDLFGTPSSKIEDSEVFAILDQVQVGLTDQEILAYRLVHTHIKTVSAGLIRTHIHTDGLPLWFAYYVDTLGGMFVDILVSYDCMLLSLPNNAPWVVPQNVFDRHMKCLNRDKSFMEHLTPEALDSYLRQIVQIDEIQKISAAILPAVVRVDDKSDDEPSLQASLAFSVDSSLTLFAGGRQMTGEPKRIGVGLNNMVVSFMANYFSSQRLHDN